MTTSLPTALVYFHLSHHGRVDDTVLISEDGDTLRELNVKWPVRAKCTAESRVEGKTEIRETLVGKGGGGFHA